MVKMPTHLYFAAILINHHAVNGKPFIMRALTGQGEDAGGEVGICCQIIDSKCAIHCAQTVI